MAVEGIKFYFPQPLNLVSEPHRFFEFQIRGGGAHVGLKRFDGGRKVSAGLEVFPVFALDAR